MIEGPRVGVDGTLHTADGVGTVRMCARFETDIEDVWSALSDPPRLARWFGTVEGDLRVGSEVAAFVLASEWDGRIRIDECVAPRHLRVTMWEDVGAEHVVAVELVTDGGYTAFEIVISDLPRELLWAYGAGWHEHVEDLGAHLAGRDRSNASDGTDARFDELESKYRAMTIAPLEH